MSYGNRLKTAMELADKDRNFLAAQMDVSVQSIGQVITGQTKAHTAENCALAAKALNVDFFWLATGKGEPRAAQPLLREERDALSLEAVKHAAAFDKLTESQKRTWRTLLMTVRSAVTDAHVAQTISAPPEDADQQTSEWNGIERRKQK